MSSSNAVPAIVGMQSTLKEFESILSKISLSAGVVEGAERKLTEDETLEKLGQELHTAQSIEEYVDTLSNAFSTTDEYGDPVSLVLSRRYIRGDKDKDQALPSIEQVQKDMERDIVVINGVQYVGAKEKLAGLRKQLASRILDESREVELDGDQVCLLPHFRLCSASALADSLFQYLDCCRLMTLP